MVGGGGGGAVFGFLIINYPSGSTLTVTNTQKKVILSATKALLYVKFPQSGQTSVTCVATITKEGETDVTESTIFESEGLSKEITLSFDSIAKIKAEIALTNYMRLSNAVGDKAMCLERGIERTTNEPIILLLGRNSSYHRAWAAVSLSPNLSANSVGGYGVSGSVKTFQTPLGTTFYSFIGAGVWGSSVNVTYDFTIDTVKERLTGSQFNYETALLDDSTKQSDLYAYIDRMAKILGGL